MHLLDWLVMLGTLLGIVSYGVWKTRNVNNIKSYLLGDRDLPWWTIGLSIMATQASAITFLSTPGQAYEAGLGFAQFYFGLPIAMVILCIFVLPLYYKLKVYTAYEYLEGRFGVRARTFTAVMFLISRGLAASITIYAPAIILSTILGWSLNLMILLIGFIVIFYTVLGGTKAVSVTQKQQMIVILSGMFLAAVILVFQLPAGLSFNDAIGVAGKMGKLEVVNFEFDLTERYNFWSGIFASVFLFLSYFGTDQSQVQRYLSGKSLAESRLGLLFNGLLKVPMQFLVLFVGILVFVFFQFTKPPVHFNEGNVKSLIGTEYEAKYNELDAQHTAVFEEKQAAVMELVTAVRAEDEATISAVQNRVADLVNQDKAIQAEVKTLIKENNSAAKVEDTDYVFITFVTQYLPIGLVGLILAVIFSAAMSSTASELNALATTSVIDIYRRSIVKDRDDNHYLSASKWFTIGWGVLTLIFATWADLFDNLIEFVNIVGSLFYGAILGIFLVAFFMKKVGGTAVFYAAIIAEIIVISVFYMSETGQLDISYLWLNPIGCIPVLLFSAILQPIVGKND